MLVMENTAGFGEAQAKRSVKNAVDKFQCFAEEVKSAGERYLTLKRLGEESRTGNIPCGNNIGKGREKKISQLHVGQEKELTLFMVSPRP